MNTEQKTTSTCIVLKARSYLYAKNTAAYTLSKKGILFQSAINLAPATCRSTLHLKQPN